MAGLPLASDQGKQFGATATNYPPLSEAQNSGGSPHDTSRLGIGLGRIASGIYNSALLCKHGGPLWRQIRRPIRACTT
jgi:hypothetical protein